MRRGTSDFRPDRPAVAEVAAGAMIVSPSGRTLLLHDAREDRWCFPKGHVEPGESAIDAALREIQEETGLDRVKILGELATVTYRFYDGSRDRSVVKSAIYFEGHSEEGPLHLEPIFDRATWCSVAEARDLVAYDDERAAVDSLARSLREARRQ
jgi:8-oxo-dGTP pyrophosphatase MutT (NUDIX family)